ncbi:recombination repair protein 1 isoform X2 [Anopheles stephensi]|uniref:recombination repair protein 1 isoform X2 n=1 Tax=Anopheles stephensi TaxID=30069 RepID=UPI00165891F8|nr:recombination repair protein 1 isoform X2 [Anopheles stephensi]
MEEKPKKRVRQPRAVKEDTPLQPLTDNPIKPEPNDLAPVVEPVKAKGGKRKVNAAETVATEKPSRKTVAAGKKAKATEQSNGGLEENEAVEEEKKVEETVVTKSAPVKKGRTTKKSAPAAVEQTNGAMGEEDPESNGSREKTPVVVKPNPVKKGARSAKKPAIVEQPDENTSSPVEEKKPKGRKTVAKDTKKVGKVEKAEPADVPEQTVESPVAPTKRGRAKPIATKQEVDSVEEPASPPKPKGRGKGKAAAKGKVEEEKSLTMAEPVTATKPNARGRKKVAALEETTPDADGEEAESGPSKTKKRAATANASNGDIPTVTQRKRTKAPVPEQEEPDTVVPSKEKKAKVAAAPKMNKCATDYATINFALDESKPWNYKISSWNVAGLRGWIGKGGLEFIDHEQPDILCVQETKCTEDQLPDEARHIKGYHPYWLCKPGGYAGVAIYSKKMPIHVAYGLGDEEQDQDGRLLTAEYEKFYLVCVYVPNAGKKLVTLPKRMRWDEKFHSYLRELDAKKPVILCGDMNVAHEEIDLANPKTNRKNAGFTQEERDGMSNLLSLGFVDTFRKLYPDRAGAYTFWTYMGGARAKNVGWRLDYFITSERLVDKVTDNVIRTQVYGSDHCPVTLFLNI